MSKNLPIGPLVTALCATAGLEPKSVREIIVRPSSVAFTVYAKPDVINEMGASEMETTLIFPWSMYDAPSGS